MNDITYKVIIPFDHYIKAGQVEEIMSILFLHIEGGWIPNHYDRTCVAHAIYRKETCPYPEVFVKYFPEEGVFTLPSDDIRSLIFETKDHKVEEVRLLLYGYMMESQNTTIK